MRWLHQDGSVVEAAVNTTSVRWGKDLFQTETHLPLTAERSNQFSEKILCSAQNFVQQRNTSLTVIVRHKPRVQLAQLNHHGQILQFRFYFFTKIRSVTSQLTDKVVIELQLKLSSISVVPGITPPPSPH